MSPWIARNHRSLLLLAVAAYVLIFSAYSLLRYYSFRTFYYDLGINAYSLSRVLQGSDGIGTLILPSSFGHLGHFSPMMLLPLGAYALFPYPETLLILQTLLLGLAALPLFDLADGVLERKDQALLVALAYFLYPPLHGVNRYDFHVEAFVPLLSFVALGAVVRGRYRVFLIASLLLLLTHEFVAIIYVFTAGVLLFHHYVLKRVPLGQWARGQYIKTMLLLGVPFVVLVAALSQFLAGRSLLYWLELSSGGDGGTLGFVSWNLVTADLLLKGVYWLLLLGPLLFTPLLGWKGSAAAIPWLAVTVLSSRVPYHSIYYQYSAFVLGPLFFGMLLALRSPKPRGFPYRFVSRHAQSLPAMMVAVALVASPLFSVLSPLNGWDGLQASSPLERYPPVVTTHDIATSKLLGVIPQDSMVLAQNELFSQLSNRREVLLSWDPPQAAPPDYIAVDVSRIFYWRSPSPPQPSMFQQLSTLLSNYSYGPIGFSDATFIYGLNGQIRGDYAAQVATMPQSPADFSEEWSFLNAKATQGSGGVVLGPAGLGPGFMWTRLNASLPSIFLRSTLAARPSPGPPGWFGIVLDFIDRASYRVIYFLPGQGQVRFAIVAAGKVNDTFVGYYKPTADRIPVQALWSGGAIQVWVGDKLAGLVYNATVASTRSLGFVTSGLDLEVSSLAAYQSTADRIPPGPDVPWPAVEAFLAMVLPALILVASRDWILGRVRRVTAARRTPQDHRAR